MVACRNSPCHSPDLGPGNRSFIAGNTAQHAFEEGFVPPGWQAYVPVLVLMPMNPDAATQVGVDEWPQSPLIVVRSLEPERTKGFFELFG